MKLDRTRPYGTITGAEDGALYEQAGHLFDAQGNELGGDVRQASEEASDMGARFERQTLHVPKK